MDPLLTSISPLPSDADLVARIRQGDRDGFGLVVEGWLCTITRRSAVQAYRHDRREPAQIGAELSGAEFAPEPPPWIFRKTTSANGPIAWRAIGGMFFFRHAEALFILGLMVTWMPLFVSLWRRRRSSRS